MRKIQKKINYFLKSSKYAVRGIRYAWKTEENFRSEVVIAVIVIILSFVFPLRSIQQVLVGLLVIWVLTLELLNTVLERMMDIMKPKVHPYIKVSKDLMAGAVLVSAAGAFVIGLIIFYPYFRNLFYVWF